MFLISFRQKKEIEATEEERVNAVLENAKKIMPKKPTHLAGYPK